jgi:hypothetical protein
MLKESVIKEKEESIDRRIRKKLIQISKIIAVQEKTIFLKRIIGKLALLTKEIMIKIVNLLLHQSRIISLKKARKLLTKLMMMRRPIILSSSITRQ